MADIVPTLFGLTPEMYQRQQQDRADAQALQYARLSPFERASFGIQRGANMLGGAIGGALGGQDPELQRITLRQQIASQIDFTDPASIQRGMNALGDDVMGKQQLAQIYRQQQESGALIAQRTAAATRERAPTGDVAKGMRVNEITRALQTPEISDLERIGLEAELKSLSPAKAKEPTTNEITNAAAFAATKGEPGTPAYTAAFQSKHSELIAKAPPAPNIKTVGVAKGTNQPVYFDQNTNEQFTVAAGPDGKPARKLYVGGVDRTTATTTVDARPLGERVPVKDWMDFSTKILSGDPTMVRTNTIISDAPSAIETIRTSATNDISAASLPSALAQLTGQGKNMSNQDVNRFARTGGLDDRLAQDAVKFFTGSTTKVKKDQAEKFATALYRGALIEQKARLQNQAEQFGYTDSPNYKIALQQIDGQLAKFKLAPKPGTTNATAPAQAGKLSDADLRKKYGVPE